ncbi:MAG: hypothetical protein JWP15_3157, partial [Alphaproteobacteria bacterium]|nr:hypothetical protein [Alphaproteobacteria bacterium]
MAFAGLTFLLLAGPAGAAAPALTADEAMKRYRFYFRSISDLDCPRDSGEIVVCGRSGGDSGRSPLRYPPQPGDRIRLLPGEAPSAAAAMGADKLCMRNCEPPV